jgi:hypothetical protein
MLERDDLLYLAGIFDGEGCCSISKHRAHAGRDYFSYTPSWKIVLTHEETISFLASKLGRPYAFQKARVGKNWKNSYRLLINDFVGIHTVLQQLLPHLHVKRDAAIVMIRFCESRMRKPGDAYHRPFTEADIAMHLSLRGLNAKGITAPEEV